MVSCQLQLICVPVIWSVIVGEIVFCYQPFNLSSCWTSRNVLKRMLGLQQNELPWHAAHQLPAELLHSPWHKVSSLPAAGHKYLFVEVQTQVAVPSAPVFSGGLTRKYIFLRLLEQYPNSLWPSWQIMGLKLRKHSDHLRTGKYLVHRSWSSAIWLVTGQRPSMLSDHFFWHFLSTDTTTQGKRQICQLRDCSKENWLSVMNGRMALYI